MNYHTVQRILGLLLMVFSITMLPPAGVSLFYADQAHHAFGSAFALILLFGAALWLPVRNERRELRLRDGFMIVMLFWSVLGLTGALPFMLADNPPMGVTDSVFESISGLTTTGATVITGLDDAPRSILFYRQQLQWLGGMGIIVLAVAVLPMLGVGGMQLYRAETPGPMKDTKLTPRITETAKALWYIYFWLTVACGLAYWAAGMEPFDAIGHAFSTVAIGGFSTHDASMAWFDSALIELVAVVFMLLSGVNFALHFVAWRRRDLRAYLLDTEFRYYLGIMLFVVTAVTYSLNTHPEWGRLDGFEAFRLALFQTVSVATTTGFTTDDFSLWPGFAAILLLFASFIGGCAGSTGGGIKVIRFVLLIKQGLREIVRLIHPSAQIPIRVGEKVIQPRVVEAVWGFFALYVASFAVMYLAIAFTGVELMTAFSAVAASINNLGPGLGEVSTNYRDLNDIAKWILCFAMLLGRLEIFTLLVLLSPAYWKR